MCEIFKASQIPKPRDEFLLSRKSMYISVQQYQQLIQLVPELKVLGISDAQKLYNSSGMAKLQVLADANPLRHLLISDDEIVKRIARLWPSVQ